VSTALLVSYIALWVLVLVLAVGLFALYHHFGELYLNSRDGRASQGPELQKPLRRANVRATSGTYVDLPSTGVPTVLLFADTDCRLCEELIPDVRRLAGDRTDVALSVVCGGAEPRVQEWARDLSTEVPVVPDPGQVLTARYGIALTPFAVAVDANGTVKNKGIVNDGDGLSYFVDAAVSEPEPELVAASRNGG
jgi:AhpC/TSA family